MNINFEWKIEPYKIEDVISMIDSNKLVLRPEYQRRSVWSKAAKSSLIETIVQRKPVPFFLIQEKLDGKLEVIDGQQRLRAISEFSKGEFSLSSVNEEIKGKNYEDFSKTLFKEFNYKDLFNNYSIYFVLIQNASEDDIIDMYTRVNKYTVNLNKMELRYALNHDTDFLNLVEELAYDENVLNFFLTSGIFTQRSVDRMGDIELFTLIVAFILSGKLGNKDEAISEALSQYGEMGPQLIEETKVSFYETLELIKFIFSGSEFNDYFEEEGEKTPQYYIKNMRFRQKNDFLSLFYTLFKLKNLVAFKELSPSTITEIRNFLIYMDSEIAPSSEISIISEYGIKCVSQSNTKVSREFRSKFILEGIDYALKEDHETYFEFANKTKLNVVQIIFEESNKLYNVENEKKLIYPESTFKNLLEILWDNDEE